MNQFLRESRPGPSSDQTPEMQSAFRNPPLMTLGQLFVVPVRVERESAGNQVKSQDRKRNPAVPCGIGNEQEKENCECENAGTPSRREGGRSLVDQKLDIFSARAIFLVETQGEVDDVVGLRSLSIQEGFNVDEYRVTAPFR